MEVCSENIMTLKKTLEVQSVFFTAFSSIKFVISSLGGGRVQVNHLDFDMPEFQRSLPSSLREGILSWQSNFRVIVAARNTSSSSLTNLVQE